MLADGGVSFLVAVWGCPGLGPVAVTEFVVGGGVCLTTGAAVAGLLAGIPAGLFMGIAAPPDLLGGVTGGLLPPDGVTPGLFATGPDLFTGVCCCGTGFTAP